MSLCPFCGTQHDTSACPPPPNPIEIYEKSSMGTINGLSFGEHEICQRLDRIIKLLEAEQDNPDVDL